MSFWTTLHLYRPTPPPVVTGPALASLLRGLHATGAFERKGGESVQVKFGGRVDRDARGTWIDTPVPGVWGISTTKPIPFDVDRPSPTLDQAAELLAGDDRPVYRATVDLGHLRGDIVEALQTRRPHDGHPNMGLWSSYLTIGPIDLAMLDSDAGIPVGWMSVGVGGNGYLNPWRPRDLTNRAAAHPDLRAVADACRLAFPVDPRHPGPMFRGPRRMADLFRARVYERHQLGELWPFARHDVPWDWYWGVCESG
jgi:hypothetical protein